MNDAVNLLVRAEEDLRNILPPESDPTYIMYQTNKAALEITLGTVNVQLEAARVIA
ncbi:hypothetical protein KEH51_23395 [[Brevibacterium] frigoritolerans]|uniref:Uncharacterized protein n=1 Tax=Peribacillus frigoritolerans TaxID=450367 RepID=A0A941J3F6_9BACI|nr:hypothetical protein [Peribacillus frigoritolerans]